MNEVSPEKFGFTLKPPVPQDFGLTDAEVKILHEKGGFFSFFDREYSCVSHKKASYKKFKEALEDYANACYRGRTEYWLAMGPGRFELEVARVFQGLGWVVSVTGSSGDRGIDIRLTRNQRLAVVQCKAYNKQVGPSSVRDFHSAVITAGAYRGFLVSARGFTNGAREEAKDKPIILIHSGDLANAELSSLAKNLGEYHMKGSRLLWDDQ